MKKSHLLPTFKRKLNCNERVKIDILLFMMASYDGAKYVDTHFIYFSDFTLLGFLLRVFLVTFEFIATWIS